MNEEVLSEMIDGERFDRRLALEALEAEQQRVWLVDALELRRQVADVEGADDIELPRRHPLLRAAPWVMAASVVLAVVGFRVVGFGASAPDDAVTEITTTSRSAPEADRVLPLETAPASPATR